MTDISVTMTDFSVTMTDFLVFVTVSSVKEGELQNVVFLKYHILKGSILYLKLV